mgnify:CR=1 FL=1
MSNWSLVIGYGNCFVIGQTAVFVAGHSGKLFYAVEFTGHGTIRPNA